ncbi:hypothetical protein E2C01_074746 [Portunus trituberculatus]|uniref:Uncharacterized protein n=1 Tax=Portunus trituberculatus TaxID=210409 RepID=A0A5B7IDY8_PORTR|nr:hypothetical protein [Portunus trituberculatus]
MSRRDGGRKGQMAPTAAFYIAVFLPEYWTSPLPVVVLPEDLRGGRASWALPSQPGRAHHLFPGGRRTAAGVLT